MRSTSVVPSTLELRSVQNPLRPTPMPKPSSPKPTLLEKQIHEADTNFKYCLEKGDINRSLHWAEKRQHLQKLFAKSRNGEHDDQTQQRNAEESQRTAQREQHDGRRCEEDPCGRNEGPGVARIGEAHIRRSEEVRPDEDQEGPHCQQEEARARQEVPEEPQEGRLRSQEGDI